MKRSLCILLTLAAGLGAQSTAKLDSDLSALANPAAPIVAVTARVTDDILALADKDARPSRQTTLDFSVELAKDLAGKSVSAPKLEAVNAAILEVLQSSGTASYRFHAAVGRFRDALIALDVAPGPAQNAANQLFILGQEVRGPEDSPPGAVK